MSIGTVDRVLHRRGRVAPETVERVERIIREEGYTPNVVARQLSLSKHYRFSVVIPSLEGDAGYWQYPKEGVDAAVRTLSLQNVSTQYYLYDRFSRESFRNVCNEVLESGCDGIILAPTQTEEAERFIAEVSDRIPLVVFDAAVGDGSELCFIGQDAFRGGVVAGRLMALLAPAARRFVIVEAGAEDRHLKRRSEGFRSYFTDSVAFETASVSGRNALEPQLREVFSEGAPDGVFVTNAMGHAVADVLNGPGTPHTPFIAYDLVVENTRALKDGAIDFIIHQRPRTQGYQAAFSLYRHVVLGEAVDKRLTMPIDVVMRENLEFYLQASSDIVADRSERPAAHT